MTVSTQNLKIVKEMHWGHFVQRDERQEHMISSFRIL